MLKIGSRWLAIGVLMLGALPLLAQDAPTTHSVSFDGIGFSFDAALGSHVQIQQFAGDAVDLEQPGGAEAPHTEFFLYDTYDAPPEGGFIASVSVRVYDVATLEAYEYPKYQYDLLVDLLADKPDLNNFMAVNTDIETNLPYMPVYPAGQIVRARAKYVETDAVTGVTYVTHYRQDVAPILGDEFLYTFQGLTLDGTKYVSVMAHLNTPLFPADYGEEISMTFSDNFGQYLTDTTATLNAAQPSDFTPNLDLIDALVDSLTVDGE